MFIFFFSIMFFLKNIPNFFFKTLISNYIQKKKNISKRKYKFILIGFFSVFHFYIFICLIFLHNPIQQISYPIWNFHHKMISFIMFFLFRFSFLVITFHPKQKRLANKNIIELNYCFTNSSNWIFNRNRISSLFSVDKIPVVVNAFFTMWIPIFDDVFWTQSKIRSVEGGLIIAFFGCSFKFFFGSTYQPRYIQVS